jgi:hypothetical protein
VLQIGVGEKILQRLLHALRRIDFPILEALLQVLGRQVDVDDLIGLGQHRIRQPLAHGHADELLDRVVQAFQMLNMFSALMT